jgi:DNA-binding transcriptional ArsR family regulator
VTNESHIVADVDMDEVFKALGDPGRRALLDALFARDGQRLNELCSVLPDITRFGVMKHLAVLESAGLVVTEKVGREKRHFLNVVPIQQISERWITKYAQPFARALTGLQRQLEPQEQSA